MNGAARWAGLPVAAIIAVGSVVGVQVANGGGTYEPLRPADPCTERVVTSQAEGLDGLTERLVLLGVNNAACTLDISRESLTLQIAQSEAITETEVDALRGGLLAAIDQMTSDDTLPLASELVDEALQTADLNGLLKRAIGLIPDAAIDSAVKTDDVLTRAINDLDLRDLLANLNDQSDLQRQVEAAVTQAVKDSLVARLRGLF